MIRTTRPRSVLGVADHRHSIPSPRRLRQHGRRRAPPTETRPSRGGAGTPSTRSRRIADFEKANPGITVEFKQYSYDDYVTALRTGLTSNDGPDVFQLQPGDLVTNFGSLAVPLEDYLSEEIGADWADRVNAEGLRQLQLDGAQVGLPSYMSAAGFIYYNATILDELGVAVPTDFDEWKAACATIEAAGYDCLAHGAKDAWVNTDVYLSLINSIAPGKVYDAIDGTANVDRSRVRQAMESWQELFTSGIVPAGATAMAEYPDAFGAFLEKKAAFIALGTWNTPGTMTSVGIAESQKTVTDDHRQRLPLGAVPGSGLG